MAGHPGDAKKTGEQELVTFTSLFFGAIWCVCFFFPTKSSPISFELRSLIFCH